MTAQHVVELGDVDMRQVAVVGGKGAQLGELRRIEGVQVPDGFCVTTDAFRQVLAAVPSLDERLARLSRLDAEDREAIGAQSADLRRDVEAIGVPDGLAAAITGALAGLGADVAVAVRSSATAEDLPTASSAGQQDSFLNVVGEAAVLRHVSRCWASLFTERAVSYRLRTGLDHRAVEMAVVVQRMVVPDAAGVLFTADPVTGRRTVAAVDAVVGLGEALVGGQVNPDQYRVRGGEIIAKTVAPQQFAVRAVPGGGTQVVPIDLRRQGRPALTDAQVLRLVDLGRRIEAHAGRPQDIEWCLVGDDIHVVQSRPITTLFPAPESGDGENHVYVSVGHGQMMTDAMKPLGLSVWQLTAMVAMHEAGGRLFVEVTGRLASPASRAGLLELMGRGDPLVRDALQSLLDRGDVVPTQPEPDPDPDPESDPESAPDPEPDPGRGGTPPPAGAPPAAIPTDPAIVTALIERSEASLTALRRDLAAASGPELFDVLLEAFQEHKRILADPLNLQAIMAAMESTWWLNDRLQEWLGEKNAADTLTLSAPGNITSQMGLELLDVADAIRPHPQVVEFLRGVGGDDGFLDELPKLEGGSAARDAIEAYLEKYGMRCVGEIDLTRPRWRERPSTLVPLILDDVRLFEPGAAARRFEQGRQEALRKQQEVLARLRELPDGDHKAEQTRRMIERVRTFIGYREYPKYAIVSRSFLYKQALLAEAERLVRAGVLLDREDSFFLTFPEFQDAARTGRVDHGLIRQRQEAFRAYQGLVPPRVLTSEGEAVAGAYRRDDAPAGALLGSPASTGTIEGRARIILDLTQADLDDGDILVTTATDPSWSPLFVAIAGLVTEVGGPMTHGAVIAREYGLPAVVGVQQATRLIRDGQRIRVHGTEGYVELLS